MKIVATTSLPAVDRWNATRSRQKKKRKGKEKIMLILVATNVVASRPPDRRPTGMPYARANSLLLCGVRLPAWEG